MTSYTMDKSFCVETVEEAPQKYGAPEIFNDERPHQSIRNKTPRQFFAANQPCAYVENAIRLR